MKKATETLVSAAQQASDNPHDEQEGIPVRQVAGHTHPVVGPETDSV